MAFVIRFRTDKFDVAKERANPINPIPGESLLLWLRDLILHIAPMAAPDTEDWGWYSYVDWNGRRYLLGASAEGHGPEREWVLQIHKQRSAKERLLGREAMTADDACAKFFRELIEAQSAFKSVSVENG